jgi:molecular chaperone DnaJ
MENKDYYKTLGVAKDADAATIKKSFRKLAMQYHPDRNKGDKGSEKKFKEINEAYEILKDDQKRAAYDRYGTANFQNTGGFHGQAGGFDDISDVFGDIFGDFMGGGRRSSRPEAQQNLRGSDLKYNTSITLEEAYKGLKRKIKFTTLSACGDCNSKGSKSDKGNKPCSACRGSGKQRMQQGFFMIEKTCQTCAGMGTVISDPCNKCHGQGRVQKEKNLVVDIPAGVDDGARIRLSGEGEAGIRGAQSGDLYIGVGVKEHEFYQRERSNLYCEIPIKMVTAILGGEVEIPTLDGKIAKISIPAETQPGSKLRLKGKGMTAIRSVRHGDLYININVELPKKVSARQKELLQEFDKLNQTGANPETDSFFAKVKNFVADIGK